MKVGTDGVILGAWSNVVNDPTILDVGCGTGLISLMLAQRCDAKITAIDISELAVQEAIENINASPWNNRIDVICNDFLKYANMTEMRFSHIISNPPFFDNCLHSPDRARAIARHSSYLPFELLLKASKSLLNADGKISIITPYEFKSRIELICNDLTLYISRITLIHTTLNSDPRRILWELSTVESKSIEESITIEKSRHVYTDEYIELTKDFYLKM